MPAPLNLTSGGFRTSACSTTHPPLTPSQSFPRIAERPDRWARRSQLANGCSTLFTIFEGTSATQRMLTGRR
jgi:hypothetical protein